jgi:DNA-binding PadR family transcriptional regulator
MVKKPKSSTSPEKLTMELRRGILILAVLSQLRETQYGYSLKKRLADFGLEIEEGTLYPLLRRLEDQGLVQSEWKLGGPRPRRYYEISAMGEEALQTLSAEWNALVEVMGRLLAETTGEDDDETA